MQILGRTYANGGGGGSMLVSGPRTTSRTLPGVRTQGSLAPSTLEREGGGGHIMPRKYGHGAPIIFEIGVTSFVGFMFNRMADTRLARLHCDPPTNYR